MNITAFDLGANMAVAQYRYGRFAAYHEVFKGKRPRRAGDTLKWVAGSCTGADLVIYERPFARGADATRCLWGIAGLIEACAHNAGAAVLDASPSEIKNWATGQGSGSKANMMDAAKNLGYSGDNEHEADAWCLLHYAIATCEKVP